MPIGSIVAFARPTLPFGWLVCNGLAVPRTEFSELFAIIGTTYGPGDGSTTFNLPNLYGRVALGSSSGYALSSSGGSEKVSLDQSSIPSHYHTVPAHGHQNNITATTPELSHSITQATFTYTALGGSSKKGVNLSTIKSYSSVSSAAMTRVTNVSVSNHAAADCTKTGGIIDCPPMESSQTGYGSGHNNMQPYLSLTYGIRFTDATQDHVMLTYNGAIAITAQGGYLSGSR